jgi:hypothetical protein
MVNKTYPTIFFLPKPFFVNLIEYPMTKNIQNSISPPL